MVVTEHVAVVGSKDDPAVAPEVRLIKPQIGEQMSDPAVNERYFSIISGPAAAYPVRADISLPGFGMQSGFRYAVTGAPVTNPGVLKHVMLPVKIKKICRWHIGRVGPGKRDVEKERAFRITAFDCIQRLHDGPGCGMKFFGEMPRPGHPGVPFDAMVIRRCAGGSMAAKPGAVVTDKIGSVFSTGFIKPGFFKAHGFAMRMKMGFPDQHGLIASPGQFSGKSMAEGIA